ncbi:unnamed protein product, partial [Protopolystoma xenopodis]
LNFLGFLWFHCGYLPSNDATLFRGIRLITPSGVSSVAGSTIMLVNAGMETPGSAIELRKRSMIEAAMEASSGLVTPSSQLYRVLPERSAVINPNEMMGSTKLYDVAGVSGAPKGIEVKIFLRLLL